MRLSGRSLLLLCLAGAGWSFSFGVCTQLATHWLDHAGVGDRDIGLNHALHYLGLILASLLAPRLIQRWGLRCSLAGLLICAASLAVLPWSGGLLGWHVLRFANGLASALALLPLETAVSRRSTDGERTRNFGFFNGCLILSFALGTWIGLSLFRPDSTLAFQVGALVPLLAAGALVWMSPALADDAPRAEAGSTEGLDWAKNFLCFGTAWVQGFLEAGLLAFLTKYLTHTRGMSQEWAGGLMGAALAGVLLIQVPVGWLSLRLGKMPVLLGCCGLLAAGLVFIPMCTTNIGVGFWLFVLGASTGGLYPLGLSLLGDRVPPAVLVRAYAWYLALDCIGSVMGDLAMGQACQLWGDAALFGTGLAATGLVLGLAAVLRLVGAGQLAATQPQSSESALRYGVASNRDYLTSTPACSAPAERR